MRAVRRFALYYPVDAVPHTPAKHFAKGKNDPVFRTKLAIGADLPSGRGRPGSRSVRSSWTAPTGIRTVPRRAR
jgi:hypothetical protein